jgi:biotin carboxyl carrier protein
MKHLRITVEGKAYQVTVERLDGLESSPAAQPAAQPAAAVRAAPATPLAAPKAAAKSASAVGDVNSPLAGIVKSIDVAVGAVVKVGDAVITLEAMKMFTAINAPTAGTITAIHVATGDAVDEDQPLFTLG